MKKRSRFFGLALMFMGSMLLLTNLGNPSIKALRGADVVKLVSSGGLLGIGFMGLMGRFDVGKE